MATKLEWERACDTAMAIELEWERACDIYRLKSSKGRLLATIVAYPGVFTITLLDASDNKYKALTMKRAKELAYFELKNIVSEIKGTLDNRCAVRRRRNS